ncbi:MerR family transcriptional regulator [Bittarella massiliensis (ex Durand et al. 2017)]|uniref:MerR family transcriptional regulator n=1 Tax=Bittarella massiliensis (ex Durand et al. 2017) TaxID=1720313 RepID=UPI001AA18E3E|nr:MerR family transcriptional regulator [Bittarella massiliensis (ex Durand et al. 2017)]MBO1678234.1 MerR family transcriptional regulator [Bittarella massiliensis (ex Durand et al. 2017)]
MDQSEPLTVGQLAAQMGVTVRTLQYYDREGLLKPSARSPGGRRLYTGKDVVRLHQIQSLKYLGFSLQQIREHLFSLDTPQQVAQALAHQREIVGRQIAELQQALNAITALEKEVVQMQAVDFKKYAEIVTLLQQKNEGYWIVKFFDDSLMEHIKDRFRDQPEQGLAIFDTWKALCDEIIALQEAGGALDEGALADIGGRWWSMVTEFTGGDLSLLPQLTAFADSKSRWGDEFRQRQERVTPVLEQALDAYFQRAGIRLPEQKEN